MKEKKKSIKKIISLVFFGLAIVFSLVFAGRVAINYNLSDYLDDSTETKIALKINDEEFGETGNVQVMVKNVSEDKADEIYDILSDVDHVTTVNFDLYDTNYYKDNNALYILLVDGDNYSENAKSVVSNIKTALSSYGDVVYGGTAVEKQQLQTSITNEMVYIMLVAVCLVAGILLLTSQSWFEPIVLLLCCGVAILINRGTNFIFGNISYITNSISAILQLALSIDYSIVLLDQYRKNKMTSEDNDEAMKKSIKEVVRPISASSLTTIAGLLALLFMSFHIGFDIGIVLMKGIVISVITSLTLLPVVVLLTDKLLTKTKKKVICPKGKIFSSFALKANKFVFPLALLLIGGCGYLQTKTTYSFSDSKGANTEIVDNFGENNSIVVLYPNQDDSSEKEQKLIQSLQYYKNANGDSVLASYTAYSNTVEEEYDQSKIAQKLEMSDSESALLLDMYELYKNPELVKMNFSDFVYYTEELIWKDDDTKEFVDEELKDTLDLIVKVDSLLDKNLTAEEFYAEMSSFDETDLSLFSVKQIYGLYFYDECEHKADFRTMLKFMIVASQNEEMSSFFDEDTISQLTSLSTGIDTFISTMDQEITKTELKGYMYSNYSVLLSDDELDQIYSGYYLSIQQEEKDTVPFLPLMKFMVSSSLITDNEAISTIQGYSSLYISIESSYDYQSFLPVLKQIAYALSGSAVDSEVSEYAIKQIYIAYYREIESESYGLIPVETFLEYILETYETDPIVQSQLSNESKEKIIDMLTIKEYMDDDNIYNYHDMYKRMNSLKNDIHSTTITSKIDEAKISGPYIKYIEEKKLASDSSVKACDLLDFVKEKMDTNTLLSSKMDEKKKNKVKDSEEKIEQANRLLKGEKYSRLLISVNLSNGGEESTKFVVYLKDEVQKTFGNDAHVTGEIISTYDLEKSFDHDNLFITIFTIISIFVIVMLTFRSISLPTILVAIIQGAVFITMSTQLLSNGVFFMSYIVVTCILMGATIDYGILMSNHYIENRKTKDKKESLHEAVEAAMPTIFTSGLILIVCGFVISFVSSQSSISTVGRLIGSGGISSIAMILFVLPATLYLLDGFIMKLTWNKKISWRWKKKKDKTEG